MLSLKDHIIYDSTQNKSDIVGLIITNGEAKVVFPHGYAIPESADELAATDEEELRDDIIALLGVLKKFKPRKGENDNGGKKTEDGRDINTGHRQKKTNEDDDINPSFPVTAYLYVIRDFLDNGYYIECEPHYKSAARGKISWKRTISQKKPTLCGDNLIYLDFIVRAIRVNDDNMLTQIHRYCVYCAFKLLGWIFTSFMPPEPMIKANIRLYKSIVQKELAHTFNDSKKMLFKSMLLILDDLEKNDINSNEKDWFGTKNFHTIWEKLIDHIYGDEISIRKFYPSSTWYEPDGTLYKEASKLRPDTIMKCEGDLFILDAKYYTYGIKDNGKLPATDSIQKQITYAEHAVAHRLAKNENVYNAFLLPFNKGQKENPALKTVLIAESNWQSQKTERHNYHYIPAVLLDTKTVIREYAQNDTSAIKTLAKEIKKTIQEYKDIRKS